MSDYLAQEGGVSTDRMLLESGGLFLLEDGTGDLLLETSTTGSTGRFTLEDGTGFVLLEQATSPTVEGVQGGIIIPVRRRKIRLDHYHLEEDEAIALSLLLRTRKRLK